MEYPKSRTGYCCGFVSLRIKRQTWNIPTSEGLENHKTSPSPSNDPTVAPTELTTTPLALTKERMRNWTYLEEFEKKKYYYFECCQRNERGGGT